MRYTDGYVSAAPQLKQAPAAFREPELSAEEGRRWLWFAAATSMDLFDDVTLGTLSSRFVQLCRDVGAVGELPTALTLYIVERVFAGELGDAAALVQEVQAIIEATGRDVLPYGLVLVTVAHGREAEAEKLIETALEQAAHRDEGAAQIFLGWMRALLYNRAGRYEQALAAVAQAAASPREMGMPTWAALIELITAASRVGPSDLAAAALRRLAEMTQASSTDWALGLDARCRALFADGPDAEAAFREAIDRVSRTHIRIELARAHLYCGEWLRRQGRRADARERLRTAHQVFAATGMPGRAHRAATELLETGEAVRKRTVEKSSRLTAQEAQLVRMVRDGLANTEIANRLFFSTRTVEWHLGNIYVELGIGSGREPRRRSAALS